jgi:hypothetical protein
MNMNPPPQVNRPLSVMDDKEMRALLRKRHPDDHRDPFANDPNAEISRLGKLALRRREINDVFTLGDQCARETFNQDGARLLIYYAGKTLTAYRRAAEMASAAEDREIANRAIYDYTRWVIEMALQYSSRRNIAVALWVIAEQDGPYASAVTTVETVDLLLQYSHRRMLSATQR